ncbi:MAG: hypothetical protein ACPG80_02080, partial [Rickettsiales bacterium]
MTQLNLAFGLSFADLYSTEGLAKLDAAFLGELSASEPELSAQLLAARDQYKNLTDKETSDLLMAVAPHAEDFITALFGIEKEVRALAEAHHALAPLYACKRLFVQRRALRAHKAE